MQSEALYKLLEDYLETAERAYPVVHVRILEVLHALKDGVLTEGQALTLLAKEARDREASAAVIAALFRAALDKLYNACDP